MPKQRGSANSETKRTERRKEEEVYNPITATKSALQKYRKKNISLKTLVIRQQSIIFANRITSVLSLAVNSDTKHFARFQIVTSLVASIR